MKQIECSIEPRLADFKNVLYTDRIFSCLNILAKRKHTYSATDVIDLRLSELRLFSQNGEDGVLDAIISNLPIEQQFFVEFGVGNGWSCNCRILAEIYQWDGLFLECNPDDYGQLSSRYKFSSKVRCQDSMVNPENINTIFSNAKVPHNLAVLVIDIDRQDYWVWKALNSEFRPAVIIIEYNSSLGLERKLVEALGNNSNMPLGANWGASFKALEALGKEKGYELVHSELTGVNLFFVREDLLNKSGKKWIGNINGCSPNWGLRGRSLPIEALYPEDVHKERPQIELP